MATLRNGPVRYATYLRCSSDDQKHGDFTTIDTQRDINIQHIAGRGGILTRVYADEGRSGTNLKRPDWQALLRDAEANLFDRICVTYMSRLARGEAYHIAEYLLKERGVEVELVREHFTSDLAGHVNKQMTILMDGMYPKMVSQWTRTKMEQMVARGYWCGQAPAIGYSKEYVTEGADLSRGDKEPPKRIIVNPDEAPIVRRAFETYVDTGSFAAVVDYLRVSTSRPWTIQTATRLIRSDVYRGVQRFGEWVNYAAHEPIITEELWEKARERDEAKNRGERAAKEQMKIDFAYHLRGLVFCPHCDGRMTPVYGTGRLGRVPYYECLKAMKKLTTCPVRRVNAATLHDSLLREIERTATHPSRMAILIREAAKVLPEPENLSSEYKQMERKLVDIDRRIARCQEAIETSTSALVPLVQRLETLYQERNLTEAKRQEIERKGAERRKQRPDVEEVCRFWRRIPELWDEANDEERTALLQAVVFRVEMPEKEKGACDASIAPQAPVRWFELNSHMGAGAGLEPATFGL